uniref:GH18 domain-containing protein n=1 Tax=Meloidogyne floridensis TaxID=298350 RepID=A0A915NJS8_9BILA
MPIYLFIILSFLFQFGICQFDRVGYSDNSNKGGYIRPCYFTNWAIYRSGRAKFAPEDYAPGLCTHIFYAFAYFNESFEAYAIDPNDLPNDSDPLGQYARVVALKKYDPTSNLLCLLEEFHLASCNEKNVKNKLIITAAVAAGIDIVKKSYDIATMAKYVDFINLMTYDFHITSENKTGYNSPLRSKDSLNIIDAANYWVHGGMPRNKIIIGFPTYAHGFKLSNPNSKDLSVGAPASGPANATEFAQEPGVAAYFEICEMLAKGAKDFYDPNAQVPYLYQNGEWFSYDNQRSYFQKIQWLRTQGFGGAFVWALDFDDFNGKCSGTKYGTRSCPEPAQCIWVDRCGDSSTSAHYACLPFDLRFLTFVFD